MKNAMVVIGFTGTRLGMSPEQQDAVRALLRRAAPDEVVHGDCIGADDEFDVMCMALGYPRRIRPCTLADMRAHGENRGATLVAAPEAPTKRNRAIVRDATMVIGCPLYDEEPRTLSRSVLRGQGTWSTILYARRIGKHLCVVQRSGSVQEEATDEHGLRTIETLTLDDLAAWT
jgi:hypothetical protein